MQVAAPEVYIVDDWWSLYYIDPYHQIMLVSSGAEKSEAFIGGHGQMTSIKEINKADGPM